MHAPKWVALWAGFVLSGLVLSQPARAIIVMGDPGRNLASTSPVPDGLDRYVGSFGGFLGTPIGPRYFVTAAHIGNQGTFRYKNGTSTETVYNDLTQVGTLDDLAIFQINTGPDFSLVAPLYTGSNEVGLPLVTLGRGTVRGAEVRLPDSPSGALRGWGWGAGDGQLSWGTNTVDQVTQFTNTGDLLFFGFSAGAGPNEGTYSSGDSGGVVFVQDPADGVWKLAGINSYVDGLFSYSQAGPYFGAALFDTRGFFVGNPSDNEFIAPDLLDPVEAGSYATRISSRIGYIQQITGVPEPGSLILLGIGAVGVLAMGRKSRRGSVGTENRQ